MKLNRGMCFRALGWGWLASMASAGIGGLGACSSASSSPGALAGQTSSAGGQTSVSGGSTSGGNTNPGGSGPGGAAAGGNATGGVGAGGAPTGGKTGTAGAAPATGGSMNQGGSAGSAGMPQTAKDTCAPAPSGAVTFSVPGGTFQGTLNVELHTEAGAEIRYTLDHTPPSATSPLYAGPIAITATTDLRAAAFANGVAVGKASAAVYVARSFDATHDLPVMVLDSYGRALPAQPMGGFGIPAPVPRDYMDAATLTYELKNGAATLSTAPQVASPGAFHIRGQSSASYAKKPYRLEMREADSTDRNCPMFGMPRESDWVLHAPFPDKALIRNAFTYGLGREMGLPAPRFAFAELYLNTATRPLEAADYQGVYLLVETIKNQKDRLNLQQLKEQDTMMPAVTGGYIFKFEWQVTDIEQQLTCPAEQANCWNWLEVIDPKPWVPEQQAYLTSYLRQFVDALHSANPSDPTTGYPAFLDVRSTVDQVIINEFTRNMDAYARSQFFYKDRGGKLFAGPLWDYDLIAGVGISMTYPNLDTAGFQYESNATRLAQTVDWFPLLLAEPAFQAALVARWKELRQTLLSDAAIGQRITALTQGLSGAAQRNFQKWNNLTTARIGFFETPVVDTWQGQVDVMRTWLLQRAAWLDTAWK
ncbi:MAG TPA: CotH kinase family protein [Polyangiaceae bacterium]|nr:CotH kinase family protein [Polyangiaceae bacterium]